MGGADAPSIQQNASPQEKAQTEQVVQGWRPSNQPGHYDEARVARLKPIHDALEKLGLPLIRYRKLHAVLSAIEMQMRTAGTALR